MKRVSEPWATSQEASFFEAIANGSSIAAAARLVGKSRGTGASKFRRVAASYGAQGK